MPVTALLLGPVRWSFYVYGNFTLKDRNKFRFVAVAEPINLNVKNIQAYSEFLQTSVLRRRKNYFKITAKKRKNSEKRQQNYNVKILGKLLKLIS